MNIGIFGGSFNPIHIGHCILANYISHLPNIDEVWLSVSPQNPLKENSDKSYDTHRLEMARLAVQNCPRIKICDIEFQLPTPSYTIQTLNRLEKEYFDHRFKLIIGADNWLNFHKWKDYEEIIQRFGIIVYPRPGCHTKPIDSPNVQLVSAPQIEISSSYIRDGIKSGMDMTFFIPDNVYHYIQANNLYKK